MRHATMNAWLLVCEDRWNGRWKTNPNDLGSAPRDLDGHGEEPVCLNHGGNDDGGDGIGPPPAPVTAPDSDETHDGGLTHVLQEGSREGMQGIIFECPAVGAFFDEPLSKAVYTFSIYTSFTTPDSLAECTTSSRQTTRDA
jgi:hypothetical protein